MQKGFYFFQITPKHLFPLLEGGGISWGLHASLLFNKRIYTVTKLAVYCGTVNAGT